MCRIKSESALKALMLRAIELYGKHAVPPPPWEIDGIASTWRTAWQVVDIELGPSGSRSREYWELTRYLEGLISGAEALKEYT